MKAVAIFILASIPAFGAVVDGVATATTVKGTGKIEAAPLQKGSLLMNGQHISTDKDSSVILWLSNGSRLVLNPGSVVLLKQLKQVDGSIQPPNPEDKSQRETGPSITEIEVESGKVIGDVKKLAPMSVYTLKTPVGTVSIKGTVFSVEYKKNEDGSVAFNIGCLVGRVTVQMADPKVAPVSIPAGKQLSVSAPAPAAAQAQPDGKGPAPQQKAAPPPMKMELAPMPPKEMAAIRIADVPMPPAGAPPPPPPPPNAPQALDRIVQEVANEVMKEQVNPSPVGG